MYKFLKKHICSVCLILVLSAVFFLNPAEVKAAGPSDMTIKEGGIIKWQAHSSNENGKSGWKFYTKYWNFTIDKEGVPIKTVKVYQGNGGYAVTSSSWWEGGDLKTNYYYSLPLSTLEQLSGICLTDGNYEITANAAMGFRKLDKNGNPTGEEDSGTYETQQAFWDRCKKAPYWMNSPETRYTGYYNKNVIQDYFYITVKGDSGIATTSGSDWYKIGSSMTASGTAKYGYTYKGDIKVTNIQTNQTVTLTTTPWQHTVKYDAAGGSPTSDSFTKVYGQIAFIDGTPPIKPGYTFTGWKSSATGDIYQPDDEYTHTQNGGTDTLVAQYTENTCTFIFDANGGIGIMEPITKKATETLALPQNGFTYDGDVAFVGWDTDSGKLVATYQPGDAVKVIDIVTTLGKQYEKEAEITIYALWDALPRISASDRYIDLPNAQNGFLTEDELFAYASAEDTEDGVIERGEKFYIKDLDLDKYKNLTAEMVNPSVSFEETYVAIDSAGNKAEKTITVTVVNTAAQPSENSSAYNYVRFISLKYLDYPPEDGGLMADSFWRIPENNVYLRRVLSIHRVNPEVRTINFLGLTYSKEVPGTGEWSAPIKQEWHFSQEDIKAVKEYVNEHGLGNSKEPDALKNFLEVFKHCRIH